MKLRFELLQELSGRPPAACQLPEGYELELGNDHHECQHCGGRLRRVRSSRHYPVGLMLGQPKVRLIHQECIVCDQSDTLRDYYQHVPPAGNYAYDLMVEVGLGRLRDQRQDAEIQSDLYSRWGLSLPASSIGSLANSFLDGLAAVHQAHAPTLRYCLKQDGGYAMHVDGTCEAETDVVFTAIAEPRGWTLEAAKMATENAVDISKLMRRCLERFGVPLAVMRDLSTNIEKAKREVLPEAVDLICHYHFLENVGEKLCEKPHAKLTAALRRLKVRPALTSLRKDLVRWTRKGQGLSAAQIDELLSHPQQIAELDVVALRRFVAYLLLRWLDDYTADLNGEYFPFDLPNLAFYRRAVDLEKMLGELVASPEFPRRELSTLATMARHLASLVEDPEVVAAAARLQKAEDLFKKLRKVLRLSSQPGKRLLRGRVQASETREAAENMQKRLDAWREKLQQRHDRERDEHKRADKATVLKYLQKYEKQLVGHVIPREGGREPLVVQRTNNSVEHRFASTKRGVRRKTGVKKLTRQVQAMRAETLLVSNLTHQDYLDVVLSGNLWNLPSEIAKHWHLAQEIRKQRLAPRTDHPMPTKKKQLRRPKLLKTVKQTVIKLVKEISKKNHAA